jgi:hypothetical protein
MAGLVVLIETLTAQEIEHLTPQRLAPRVLFDYFSSQFFDRMDPGVKDVLMLSAFLPRMTTKALEDLTGVPYAGRVLQDLDRAGTSPSSSELTNPPISSIRSFGSSSWIGLGRRSNPRRTSTWSGVPRRCWPQPATSTRP